MSVHLCLYVRAHKHSGAKNKKSPSMWSCNSAAKHTPPNAALLERKRGV